MRANLLKIVVSAAFIGFIFCLTATAARAQIQPFVDCIEQERDSSGALTGYYNAYFGYYNYSFAQTIPTTSSSNSMTPIRFPAGQPTRFEPGLHPRVFSVRIANGATQTWVLTRNSVTANYFSTLPNQICATDEANPLLTTYQGKLSDGATQANGVYDLRFQLFDAATGGKARTTPMLIEDVSVTNGIFTVQLNLGANNLVYPSGSADEPFAFSQPINAAIAEGSNGFFEIGVRPGSSTGEYTTLTPRQPLTAVPLAMRANMAVNAIYAGSAERLGTIAASQFVQTNDGRLSDARTPTAGSANYIQNTTAAQTNSNFNISGSGVIGGTLTANNFSVSNGTVSEALTANSLSVSGTGTVGGTLTANAATANGFRARDGAPGAFGVNNNGYGFKDDTDSGLYSGGQGQVSLYTDSNERVRVTGSGLQIFGTLTANTKNFKIDHPLDPLNKTLTYTSIESPDMMNIYNGNVTTDGNGEAIVKMPDYFEALNRDFRYQLTVIGTFAQAIVLEKIKDNRFVIKSDKPNVEVSWQITGIRRDKFAEDNRPTVEETKSADDKGKCIYAPACRNDK